MFPADFLRLLFFLLLFILCSSLCASSFYCHSPAATPFPSSTHTIPLYSISFARPFPSNSSFYSSFPVILLLFPFSPSHAPFPPPLPPLPCVSHPFPRFVLASSSPFVAITSWLLLPSLLPPQTPPPSSHSFSSHRRRRRRQMTAAGPPSSRGCRRFGACDRRVNHRP